MAGERRLSREGEGYLTQDGSSEPTGDQAAGDGTADDFRTAIQGDARLLHVPGLAGPAARLRVTPEGVELTFLAERRAGFLAWLSSDAAGYVHRLMRAHEREADVDEAFAEPLAAMPDVGEGAASGPGLRPAGTIGRTPGDEG